MWNREPAVIRTAILAVLALAVSFGLRITDVQMEHIDAVIVAVLALLTGVSIRSSVSPVDEDGKVIK